MQIIPNEEDRRIQLMQEARHLAVASPVIIPMLQNRKTAAFNKLLSIYREGKTDFITTIAELSVMEAFLRDINSKLEYLQLMEDKNGNTK